MSRVWFLVLAVSLGLNAGLLYVQWRMSGMQGEERIERKGGRDYPRRGGPPHGRPGTVEEMRERHMERLSRRLDLSEEQREALDALTQETFPGIAEKRRELSDARRQIAEAFREEPYEEGRVREQLLELGRIQKQLDSLVAESIVREGELLSEDQRGKYVRGMPWGRHAPRGGPGDRKGRGK